MQQISTTVSVVMFALSLAVPSRAQMTDHLKCYKMKDPVKLSAIVELSSQFGLEPGCQVKPAKLFCVPAAKTVNSAVDKATGLPIPPLAVFGADPGDRICYNVKCPNPATALADQPATDQFGTRTLSKFKTALLCTPAVTGTAFCGDGTVGPGEQCEGANLGGATCQSRGLETGTLACGADCQFDTSGCACVVATTCGNGLIDGGEQCEGANLGGATCASLGYSGGGSLACSPQCAYDRSGCMCMVGPPSFPATGETAVYPADKNDGIAGPVAVPDDGTMQAGATLSFTDNGDGTITDSNTGLIWEKKSNDDSVHDVDLVYPWAGNGITPTVWEWIDDVNAEGGTGFAGHNDWRIPNIKELMSIVNYGARFPSISPAFNTGCAPGCTVLNCSCTASHYYASSTTQAGDPFSMWHIEFTSGLVYRDPNFFGNFLRAVRGGS